MQSSCHLVKTGPAAVPTQRATILVEQAAQLVAKEADGRTFRLIGVGVDDLRPAAEGDPPDLFA